jgi:YidC/Oxa1 family membrane protein insertase
MPVLFTFMLAQFPAGLVIYWTWNNLLTILQQGVIMRRQGVKIELWDNLGFGKSAAGAASTPRGGNNGNSNGRSRKPAE